MSQSTHSPLGRVFDFITVRSIDYKKDFILWGSRVLPFASASNSRRVNGNASECPAASIAAGSITLDFESEIGKLIRYR